MSAPSKPTHSPRFEVSIAGKSFTEADAKVSDLVVETVLDGADRFSCTLSSGFDPGKQKFRDFSWSKFKTGKNVGIKIGWGGDGTLTPLFKGKIHKIKTSFTRDRGPSVGVSGYGLIHDMMRGTPDDSWSDTKLGDVVNEKLSSYFGKKEVKTTGGKRKKIIQHDQSDYRFVRGLAEKYGYRFYADRDKAYFVPRSSVGSGDPVVTLKYAVGLDSFDGEINESSEVSEVEVRYWNMENEQEVTGKATTDAKNDKKQVFRIPCRSQAEAESIAENKLSQLSKSRIEGHGEARKGIPELTAGNTITLKDLGDRFSGKYFVKRASHRIGSSGYRTSFEVSEVPE